MRKSYIVAALVVLIAAAWIASGQFSRSERTEERVAGTPIPEQEEPLAQARVARLMAQPITSKVIVQGETQPNRAVEVKAEVRGAIIEINKERGAKILEGETIALIADDGRTEQLEKAEAQLKLRQAEFEAAQSLTETGFNSRIRLAETQSNLISARAELKTRQIDVDNLEIKAPFDGVLDERLVEAGEFVEVGRSVAKAVELDPIKVVGQVSETNVNDIRVGMVGQVELIGGRTFPATLTFRSSTADPETRTFEIELQAPNADGGIVGGLTATIVLPTGERMGHLVSPSVLTLSDSGKIGVKIVDEDSRVRFVPVAILDEGPQGTWIGGLPAEVDLVTVGQDFVSESQRVERVYIETAGS